MIFRQILTFGTFAVTTLVTQNASRQFSRFCIKNWEKPRKDHYNRLSASHKPLSVLRGPAHKDNEGILNCPYCSSILEDSVCPSCGRICERCGLPYHEAACPECYTSTAWLAGESQHGEVAPATFQKIVRSPSEGSVSRRESEMLRGTFIDRQAKTIHDRVTSACSMMNLSALVRSRLQERAERTATRLVRKWEVAPEQAVKFAVLLEARAFGKQLSEIQSLLASAGFNMKLDSIFLDIAARSVKDVKLFINSERRTFRSCASPTRRRSPWCALSPLLDTMPSNSRSR